MMMVKEDLQTVTETAQTLGISADRLRRLSAAMEENGAAFPRNNRRGRLYSATAIQQLTAITQRVSTEHLSIQAAVRAVLAPVNRAAEPAADLAVTVQSQQKEINQLRQLVSTVIEQNTRILEMLHQVDPNLADQVKAVEKRDVTTRPTEISAAPPASAKSRTHTYLDPHAAEIAVEHNDRPKTLADMQLPADDHPKRSWWERFRR